MPDDFVDENGFWGVSMYLTANSKKQFNIWNASDEDITLSEESARKLAIELTRIIAEIDEAAQ